VGVFLQRVAEVDDLAVNLGDKRAFAKISAYVFGQFLQGDPPRRFSNRPVLQCDLDLFHVYSSLSRIKNKNPLSSIGTGIARGSTLVGFGAQLVSFNGQRPARLTLFSLAVWRG
jgi:hypothetical protein